MLISRIYAGTLPIPVSAIVPQTFLDKNNANKSLVSKWKKILFLLQKCFVNSVVLIGVAHGAGYVVFLVLVVFVQAGDFTPFAPDAISHAFLLPLALKGRQFVSSFKNLFREAVEFAQV